MHLYDCSIGMLNVSTDNWDETKGISRQFISEKMEPLEKMLISLLMT